MVCVRMALHGDKGLVKGAGHDGWRVQGYDTAGH